MSSLGLKMPTLYFSLTHSNSSSYSPVAAVNLIGSTPSTGFNSYLTSNATSSAPRLYAFNNSGLSSLFPLNLPSTNGGVKLL